MGKLPLEELLPLERGTDRPDEDLTPTSRIRRALFHGEALTREEVMERFGVSHGLLAQVVATMEKLGYHFTREDVGDDPADQTLRYSLTNPAHIPRPAQLEAVRARGRAWHAAKSARSAPVAVTQESPPPPPEHRAMNYTVDLPPLPQLGGPVLVYAQVINDDGSVTLGLRNGTRRWMTTVTGATEVTP